MASLQDLGIADQDIQTVAYTINPEYSSEQGQPGQVTGYRVTNTVRVTVRNLDHVGQVLDAATQAGANNIHGTTGTCFAAANSDRQRIIFDLMESAVSATTLTAKLPNSV